MIFRRQEPVDDHCVNTEIEQAEKGVGPLGLLDDHFFRVEHHAYGSVVPVGQQIPDRHDVVIQFFHGGKGHHPWARACRAFSGPRVGWS